MPEDRVLPRGISKLSEVLNMFFIFNVVMISWMFTYVKCYQVVHFKYMQFFVCQVFLHKPEKKEKKRKTLAFTVFEDINHRDKEKSQRETCIFLMKI